MYGEKFLVFFIKLFYNISKYYAANGCSNNSTNLSEGRKRIDFHWRMAIYSRQTESISCWSYSSVMLGFNRKNTGVFRFVFGGDKIKKIKILIL